MLRFSSHRKMPTYLKLFEKDLPIGADAKNLPGGDRDEGEILHQAGAVAGGAHHLHQRHRRHQPGQLSPLLNYLLHRTDRHQIKKRMSIRKRYTVCFSVVIRNFFLDPELFVPDPNPAGVKEQIN